MATSKFYERQDWQRLRYRILNRYGFKCMACGFSRVNGEIIHVDHIKPISEFPELALSEDNLQVLCATCNLGKSDRFVNDFRPNKPIKTTEDRTRKICGWITKTLIDPPRIVSVKRQQQLISLLEKLVNPNLN